MSKVDQKKFSEGNIFAKRTVMRDLRPSSLAIAIKNLEAATSPTRIKAGAQSTSAFAVCMMLEIKRIAGNLP